MPRALPVVLVLAVLSLATPVPAHAVLITVNFTFQGYFDDPLYQGDQFSGSFSFDSSIVPAPGTGFVNVGSFNNTTTDYASSIDFTFNGTTWTENNAGLVQLQFDNGQLHGWVLKGDAPGDNFQLSSTEPDFILHSFSGGTGYGYSHPGTSYGSFGTVTWTVTTSDGSAPEPTSWMLLGGALVGLVGVRRGARK
jgi:PEP-CTERM motif